MIRDALAILSPDTEAGCALRDEVVARMIGDSLVDLAPEPGATTTDVRVKPLRWNPTHGGTRWIAGSLGMTYTVQPLEGPWAGKGWAFSEEYGPQNGPWPDADAAKMGAQKYYEARVLSALADAPEPEDDESAAAAAYDAEHGPGWIDPHPSDRLALSQD